MVKVVDPGIGCWPHPSDVLTGFLPTERLYFSSAIGTRQSQRFQSPGSGGDDEAGVLGQLGQLYKVVTNDDSAGFLSCAATTALSAASTAMTTKASGFRAASA